MKKKMLKNTLWLKNRYDFLKSYIKLLKEKDITETVNNEIISSEIFKNFMNAILYGAIDNNNIKEAYDQHLCNIEKYLNASKSSKNVDKLKNYLIKIKNLVNKTDTAIEYDTGMPFLETEEEAANIYESKDDTRKKEKSDFNEYNIDINSLDKDGYKINGVDENGVDKNGFNMNGIKETRKKYSKREVNWRDDDGVLYDQYGFDIDGFNKDGYDIYGFNKEKLNKDGLNKFGYKKKSGKGLNISSLPILLSKIYTNNSSKEIKNDIKQLVKNLYENKQITEQVYNILNKALMSTAFIKNDS